MQVSKTESIKKFNSEQKINKAVGAVFSSIALVIITVFISWWFNPAHLPSNFSGNLRILDVLLFIAVSYVVLHPLIMEVLTWCISSHIKDLKFQKPIPGLRVAFITTIVPKSEPVELLHKCLPAMVNADYKHDTWILDEGDNPEVKKICDKYGVYHFSRFGLEEFNTKKGKYTKTKGGNHNSWYDSYGRSYDYVAQIDTDFVPKKNFLTKTLGYFRDSKVAFVGTPQIYGNTDKSLIALGAAEQQFSFYGAVLRGLSGIGMTLLIGANHVIRVAAFNKANHYTAHITEDLVTGMKLHSQGWKSVYVAEPLAVGEGPSTWESYFSQQLRWAYGCIDILFHHSFKFFGKMGLRQKIYYFFLQQHYFSGLAMALSIVLLTLYFLFGIRAADIDVFFFFLSYSFILIVCWLMSAWLQQYDIDKNNRGKLNVAGKIISIAAWPIWFTACISTLAGKPLSYKVTPKGDDESPENSSPMAFLPHYSFATVALSGFVGSFFTHQQSSAMLFWALCSAALILGIPYAHNFVKIFSKLKSILFKVFRKALNTNKKSVDTSIEISQNPAKIIILDCIFLTTVVIASVVTYIHNLGFYSDDWSFLGEFSVSKNQTFIELFKVATTPNTFMRPMQNFYDALLYKLFGLNPIGYHLVNSAVFVLIVVLFYLILRKVKVPRIIALSSALIYSLLPNFSTDRFWYAAFQVNLSLSFFLASLYMGLIGLSYKGTKGLIWKILNLLFLILSILSYEIVIPLLIVNVILFTRPVEKIKAWGKKFESNTVFIAVNFITLFYLIIFKAKTTIRLGDFNLPGDIIYLLHSITQSNFIELGVKLPLVWGKAMLWYQDMPAVLFGIVLYSAVFAYLYLSVFKSKVRLPDTYIFRNSVITGLVIFLLGYAIFFSNNKVGFSPVGLDNRVALAASLGIAFIFVGICGIISKKMFPLWLSKIVFCMLISFLCFGGFITISALGSFWSTASAKGKTVLEDINTKFPEFPKNSVLILDGVCPYSGPAVVFESQWDLKGAMQTIYKDPTLQADIVTPRLKLTDKGIKTQIYTFEVIYPYKNIFIYNFKNKRIFPVNDMISAQNYFSEYNPDFDNNCPPATAGNGVNIF